MARENRNRNVVSTDNSMINSRQLLQNVSIDPALKFKVEEAYKSIRTNLAFSVMKKGCKTIVVSSSVPNEGKTTTTINLAITFAQANQRVLLIDCDLRKPKIHHYFSIPNSPGLTNYIGSTVSGKSAEKVNLYSVIHTTEYPNLSVICSGSIPPNPAELLGSEPMRQFIEEIGQDFDYIIIDTPPINVVSDALPIIKESDGVVLIVRSNQSTYPEVEKAISSLKFIDAKILGFVVNFVDNGVGKYGYSKYGKYKYGRYSGKYSSYGNYGGTYGSYGGYGGYGSYGSYGSYGGYGSYGSYSNKK